MGAPPHERPMRADARRNYDQIVATARETFTELGPTVPLDVIARRAGVGNATLYRHFPTREVLIEVTYRTDIEAMVSSAHALAEQHAPREALERWVREIFVPAQEERGVTSIVKDALAAAPEVFSQGKQRFNEAADRLVSAAQDAGHIRRDVETHDILRMAHGIATASEDEPDARERMLTVMFDGLRPA